MFFCEKKIKKFYKFLNTKKQKMVFLDLFFSFYCKIPYEKIELILKKPKKDKKKWFFGVFLVCI